MHTVAGIALDNCPYIVNVEVLDLGIRLLEVTAVVAGNDGIVLPYEVLFLFI